MHGHREEEDRVAVVGPGAGTEVLLHGLHDGEELLRQHTDIMEDNLQEGTGKGGSEYPSRAPGTRAG